MNRAPRELIEDLQAALTAERQARQALREASHRSVQVMVELRAAGVPWTLIARHAAQILGRQVSEVGRLAATLRQRAWSVSRDHEIRAGASGAGAAISSSSSGRDQLGGKDSEMPSEKKIIKRTTTTVEEFEPQQPEEEGLDDLDDPDEPDDEEEEGRGKPRSKRPTRAA
jgi:hypothetical protein